MKTKKTLMFAFVMLLLIGGCTTKTKVTKEEDPTPKVDGKVCCESFGYGSEMKKCCETYEMTLKEECETPEGMVGGGKQVVDDSLCNK